MVSDLGIGLVINLIVKFLIGLSNKNNYNDFTCIPFTTQINSRSIAGYISRFMIQ